MSEIGVFVRNCIDIERDKDKSRVLSMWLAFNYDQKGVQEYVNGTSTVTSKKGLDSASASDWNKLARSMRTFH